VIEKIKILLFLAWNKNISKCHGMKKYFPSSLLIRVISTRNINIKVNTTYIPLFPMFLTTFSWNMYFIFLEVLVYFGIYRRKEELRNLSVSVSQYSFPNW